MRNIDETNVMPASMFLYSSLSLTEEQAARCRMINRDATALLLDIRTRPSDTPLNKNLYDAAKDAGYIRNDIFISYRLQKFYEAITGEKMPNGELKDIEEWDNEYYESAPAIPESCIGMITFFLWNWGSFDKRYRYSGYERNILFEYYGISREPVECLSVEDIARKYYSDQPDSTHHAEKCINSIIDKARVICKVLNDEFVFRGSGDAMKNELKKLFSCEDRDKSKQALDRYIWECRKNGEKLDFSFVDIGYVILDTNLRSILKREEIDNLQKLLDAFEDGRMRKISKDSSTWYTVARRNVKNFFYTFNVQLPDYLR